MKKLVTIKDVQKYCKEHFNVTAKNTYIAHAKELNGLLVLRAPNRKGEKRLWPCPIKMQPLIKIAFIDLGLLPKEDSPPKVKDSPPKVKDSPPKVKQSRFTTKKSTFQEKQAPSILTTNQTFMIKQFSNRDIQKIKAEFDIN